MTKRPLITRISVHWPTLRSSTPYNRRRRYSRAPLSAHSSEETRIHNASASSSHLLNLLSSFTVRTNSGLRACKPHFPCMPSLLNLQPIPKHKHPVPLLHTQPLHAKRGTSSLPQNRFCFSYSYLNPQFYALYNRLEEVNTIHVSHTADYSTSRTVLFSGIEVKPENGDQKEVELQMGIQIAASLQKKIELAWRAFFRTPVSESEPASNSGVGHDSNKT